jgi:hypothetical protein
LPSYSGEGGASQAFINLKKLPDCTLELFDINTVGFIAAKPGGDKGGNDGLFVGYIESGVVDRGNTPIVVFDDAHSIDGLGHDAPGSNNNLGTDVGGYVDLGKDPHQTYSGKIATAEYSLVIQLTELGNALYYLSGVMTIDQELARDNSPNPTPDPNHIIISTNDPPGNVLVRCLIDAPQ